MKQSVSNSFRFFIIVGIISIYYFDTQPFEIPSARKQDQKLTLTKELLAASLFQRCSIQPRDLLLVGK